jgi:hypothetical protein
MTSSKTKILEQGDIFFLYRPKVNVQLARGIEDIQRFYVILKPSGMILFRRIIVGEKRLPDVGEFERAWGFVDRVSGDPEEIEDELDSQRYQTKTHGERVEPAARPAGEGIYAIVRHGEHTHIAYILELPRKSGEVQRELNIRKQGSIIVTVKNPKMDSPPQAGLPEMKKPKYPATLQRNFSGKRFTNLDPPEFLDYPGTELVLVGVPADVTRELGIKLHPRHKDEETAAIFSQLKMEKDLHPTAPLISGKWA